MNISTSKSNQPKVIVTSSNLNKGEPWQPQQQPRILVTKQGDSQQQQQPQSITTSNSNRVVQVGALPQISTSVSLQQQYSILDQLPQSRQSNQQQQYQPPPPVQQQHSSKITIVKAADVQAAAAAGNKFAVVLKTGELAGAQSNKNVQQKNGQNVLPPPKKIHFPSLGDAKEIHTSRSINTPHVEQTPIQAMNDGKKTISTKAQGQITVPVTKPEQVSSSSSSHGMTDGQHVITTKRKQQTMNDDIDTKNVTKNDQKANPKPPQQPQQQHQSIKPQQKPQQLQPEKIKPVQPTQPQPQSKPPQKQQQQPQQQQQSTSTNNNNRMVNTTTTTTTTTATLSNNNNNIGEDDFEFIPPTSFLPSIANQIRSRTVGQMRLHESIPTNLLPHVTETIYKSLFQHFISFCEKNHCEVIPIHENYRTGEVEYESYTVKNTGTVERLKFEFKKSIKNDFSQLTPKLFKTHSIFSSSSSSSSSLIKSSSPSSSSSTGVSITTSVNKMYNYPSINQLDNELEAYLTPFEHQPGSVYYSLLAFTRTLPSFHERNGLSDLNYWAHLTLFKSSPRDYPHPFLYIPVKISHPVYPGLGCIRTQISIKAAQLRRDKKSTSGSTRTQKQQQRQQHDRRHPHHHQHHQQQQQQQQPSSPHHTTNIDPTALDVAGTPYKPDFSKSTLLDPFWWCKGLDYLEKQHEKVYYQRQLGKYSAQKRLDGYPIHTPDSPLYKQQQLQLMNEMYQQTNFIGYKSQTLAERIKILVQPDLRLNKQLTIINGQIRNTTTGLQYIPITQRGFIYGYSEPCNGLIGANGNEIPELHRRRWQNAYQNSKLLIDAYNKSLQQGTNTSTSSLMAALAQSSAISGALVSPPSTKMTGGTKTTLTDKNNNNTSTTTTTNINNNNNPNTTPILLIYAKTNRLCDQLKILTMLPEISTDLSSIETEIESSYRKDLFKNINPLTRTISSSEIYSINSPYNIKNGTNPLITMSNPDLASSTRILYHITGSTNKEAMIDLVREISNVTLNIQTLERELAPSNRPTGTGTATATAVGQKKISQNQTSSLTKSSPGTAAGTTIPQTNTTNKTHKEKLVQLSTLQSKVQLLNTKFSYIKTLAQSNLHSILVPQSIQISENSSLFNKYPDILQQLIKEQQENEPILYYLPYHPKRNIFTSSSTSSFSNNNNNNNLIIPRTKIPISQLFYDLKIIKTINLSDLNTTDTLLDYLISTTLFRISIPSLPRYYSLIQYIDDYNTFYTSPMIPKEILSKRLKLTISSSNLSHYGVTPLTSIKPLTNIDDEWTPLNNKSIHYDTDNGNNNQQQQQQQQQQQEIVYTTDILTIPPGTNTYMNYTSYTRPLVDLYSLVPLLPLLTHKKFLTWIRTNKEFSNLPGITMNIKSLYYYFKSGNTLEFTKHQLLPVVSMGDDDSDDGDDDDDDDNDNDDDDNDNDIKPIKKSKKQQQQQQQKYQYSTSIQTISNLPYENFYPWSDAAIEYDRMIQEISLESQFYNERLINTANGIDNFDPENDDDYKHHQQRTEYYKSLERSSWPDAFSHVYPDFYKVCDELIQSDDDIDDNDDVDADDGNDIIANDIDDDRIDNDQYNDDDDGYHSSSKGGSGASRTTSKKNIYKNNNNKDDDNKNNNDQYDNNDRYNNDNNYNYRNGNNTKGSSRYNKGSSNYNSSNTNTSNYHYNNNTSSTTNIGSGSGSGYNNNYNSYNGYKDGYNQQHQGYHPNSYNSYNNNGYNSSTTSANAGWASSSYSRRSDTRASGAGGGSRYRTGGTSSYNTTAAAAAAATTVQPTATATTAAATTTPTVNNTTTTTNTTNNTRFQKRSTTTAAASTTSPYKHSNDNQTSTSSSSSSSSSMVNPNIGSNTVTSSNDNHISSPIMGRDRDRQYNNNTGRYNNTSGHPTHFNTSRQPRRSYNNNNNGGQQSGYNNQNNTNSYNNNNNNNYNHSSATQSATSITNNNDTFNDNNTNTNTSDDLTVSHDVPAMIPFSPPVKNTSFYF